MTVAASKVKALCTGPEVALVRASRKPELEKHSPAELKSLATRARKLFDKWQGQKRGQARARGREVGHKSEAANTQLKMQIFREALDAFEAQLAKVSSKGAAKAAKPGKTKSARAAEHRQTRAAVRSGMSAIVDLKNQDRATKAKRTKTAAPAKKAAAKPTKKAVAKPAAAPVPVVATTPAKTKAAKPVKKAPKKAAKKVAPAPQTLSVKQQLRATTVAKQARVEKSGKTTRVLGHVSARGKRAQARRDGRS